MSADRKSPKYAGIAGARRRNRIVGQWSPRLTEMLESFAWRALSLSGHRVIDRIDIELRHHAGRQNGDLIVTFDQFEQYGIHRHSIAPAIREVEALGFIEITERGRGGNAEFRSPHRFRITYQHTDYAEPTHEWRRIATIKDAERTAKQARDTGPTKASGGKRQVSVRKPPPKTGNSQWRKPHYCASAESTTTIDISGAMSRSRAKRAAFHPKKAPQGRGSERSERRGRSPLVVCEPLTSIGLSILPPGGL